MPLALADISGATPVGVTIGTLHGIKAGSMMYKGDFKKDDGDSNNALSNISNKGASKVAKVFGQALNLENHRHDYLGEVADEIGLTRETLKEFLANNFIGVYDYKEFVRVLHHKAEDIRKEQVKRFRDRLLGTSSPDLMKSINQGIATGVNAIDNSEKAKSSYSTRSNQTLEQVMLETWDAGDDADISKLIFNLTRHNCNYQTEDSKKTPLMILAGLSTVEGTGRAIRTAKRFGADPKKRDNKCWTALHWAAFSGNIEATQELVKDKEILFLTTREGRTALQVALREGNTESAQIIIEASR